MIRFLGKATAGLAVLLVATTAGAASALPAPSCHVGAYAFADGTTVDIAPSSDDLLRWRRPDGTSGAFALSGAQAGASRLG